MQIDKKKIFELGNYTFQNFITLNEKQVNSVWEWRNHPNIRRFMYNKEIITFENHQKFINSLPSRDDVAYWLVFLNGNPIGVTNLVDINWIGCSAEPGSYMIPELDGTGMGLDFFYHNIKFYFSDCIGCKYLHGSIHRKNINALLLDSYLGFVLNDEDVRNPDCEYIKISHSIYEFDKLQIDTGDVVKYVSYIKQNKKQLKL